MTKEGYLAAIEFFGSHKGLLKAAVIIQKASELAVYVIYPLFIALLFLSENDFYIKSVLVCGVSFFAITLLRIRLNVPRPYEKYDFTPLIKKESRGRSFPSRHAFSAAIIALNVGVVCPFGGALLGVLTLIISFLRVVLGVHFIKDVVFGIVAGILLGAIVLI